MGFGSFMEDVTVKLEPKDTASANAVTILNNIDSLGTINNWGDQRTAKYGINHSSFKSKSIFLPALTSSNENTSRL